MQEGFQLASFILQDRPMAIRVVMDALNKLELQHNREQKRAYWRDKHLKGRITRIARQNIDALQWLIYFESEAFEKVQEQSGGRAVPPDDNQLHQTPFADFHPNVSLLCECGITPVVTQLQHL